MKLSLLHPRFDDKAPQEGIQEILRSILIRTNLVPGIRNTIGWRGLKDASADFEGWTLKVANLPGVFGIAFAQFAEADGWFSGLFDLAYFPASDEDLVEQLSVQAGVQTQRQDYQEKIRSFLLYPQFREAFHIGTVSLSLSTSQDALLLGLESLSQQVVVSKNGISISKGSNRVEIVPPGGIDQDFPAFDTAYRFFKVLVASLAFNLGEAPDSFGVNSSPGNSFVYDDDEGSFQQLVSETIELKRITAGFGAKNLAFPETVVSDKADPQPNQSDWQTGLPIPAEFIDELWWQADRIGTFSPESKEISGIDNRPQLILVTGFLGSGKTSFLQHFIEYQSQASRFTAVIQNEIGEIGLDAKLLNQDFAVTEMDEGCVCCTLVGNLKSAVHDLLDSYHPDFILLETTGLANPFNLLEELDELTDLVRFDSVATLVDGLNFNELLDQYDITTSQIKAADLLILNKTDQLADPRQREITARLKQINPDAPIVPSAYGDVNPALLFDPVLPTRESQTVKTELAQIASHAHAPGHHHSHHADGLSSVKISCPRSVKKEDLIHTLTEMPQAVYRIKGVVDLMEYDAPMLVQFVGGRYEISQYPNENPDDRYLIIIGQHLDDCFNEDSFKVSLGF